MARDPERPLRADARRNRDKILSTAVRVFAEDGLGANLNRIAREAGVGAGTLYRNFPTRETLVEEAYVSELEKLCEAAPALLAELPPAEALRAWMSCFLDYATAKIGMADALRAVIDSGRNPYARTQERMLTAIAALLAADGASSPVRRDVGAGDVLAMITGIALSCGQPVQRDRAERLMDLIRDALLSRPA